MPIGRPSAYSTDIALIICARISSGSNLNKLCEEDGFPHRDTIYQWLRSQPAFADNYARAREDRADHRFDRIDDVILDMRAGKIDAQQARVEIDTIKWQAGKEQPNKYGDRTAVEHSGTVNVAGALADTIRANRTKREAGEE